MAVTVQALDDVAALALSVAGNDDPRQTARYSFGEMPIRRWKAARTDTGAPSPVRRPMFSTGSVVVSRISRARSMRASASHAIGDTPVSSRNRRLSVRRDTCARVASVPRSRGRERFSSIQSRRGPSWSPLASGMSRSMNCACPP